MQYTIDDPEFIPFYIIKKIFDSETAKSFREDFYDAGGLKHYEIEYDGHGDFAYMVDDIDYCNRNRMLLQYISVLAFCSVLRLQNDAC